MGGAHSTPAPAAGATPVAADAPAPALLQPFLLLLPPLTCCCRSCCRCRRCRAVPAAAPAPALVFARSALFDRLCCSCSFGFRLCPFGFRSGSFALVCPAVHPYPLVWLSFAVVRAFRACALLLRACLRLSCCSFVLARLSCFAPVCVCLFVLVRARSSSFV